MEHKANHGKLDILFDLYTIYRKEYKAFTLNYWHNFTRNKINRFSHLGSTKHIDTKLNASYLQICLSQSCATLNNHLANIKNKFNHFINTSSITDKDFIHQLRSINSQHAWLNIQTYYYPILERTITDDYGDLIIFKEKPETPVSAYAKRFAKRIFKHKLRQRAS